MGTINPLANSLLDGAKKCFQTLELSYLYYAVVGKKKNHRDYIYSV